jgi:hypothetical protein
MATRTSTKWNENAWWHDVDEAVAFARWYWQGALNFIGSAGEILDFFEKPWKFDEEYQGYKHRNEEY